MANLDPKAVNYLELFYQMPALHTLEPEAVRNLLAQTPTVEVELASVANIEDRMIVVDDNAQIKIRIYTPEGEGPFPLFVYYHGGGWVIGNLETADATCRQIANLTGSVVVSVDYRLAPEYKYPIPVRDSYEALKWVEQNAASLNGNAHKIAVGGDSAGGNLAAVAAMIARDQKGPAIAAQILVYPVTNLGYDTPSYEQFQSGYGLDKALMVWFGSHYIRTEADRQDKYIAPLLAEDLGQLPPALIIVAENDVLRDEGLAYAERLQQAGVQVETSYEHGLIHGYFTNMAVFPERIKQTVGKIAQFLKQTM
ncbi:alpha/beta hydrolase [Brevibacillus fulvus]|uniref:Acetyl esterase n=1 Tax=Brevibacillus fulvus TaxID=1125967 RepID=A0A939BVB9_9BACL|nr:alpha/beta hydrolase [Brevibacillus fulvus]MBM7590506.1 acetyl esterase [Brevibacillus fulvus]